MAKHFKLSNSNNYNDAAIRKFKDFYGILGLKNYMHSKKLFLLFLVIVVYFATAIFTAPFLSAGTSEVIIARVTPNSTVVSVTLDTTVLEYGNPPLGLKNRTPQSDPVITATNNGTVPEDFLIRGADAIGGGTFTWDIADTQGTDQFVHKFGIGASPATWEPLSDIIDDTLATNVSYGDDEQFKMRMDLPTKITGTLVQYETTVTVTAVQH